MSDFLPFIVTGLATGAIYGLFGTGLVLTYKTSGIFNFGHGALATIAAYLFYALHVVHGVDWRVAAAVTILVLNQPPSGFMQLLLRSPVSPLPESPRAAEEKVPFSSL